MSRIQLARLDFCYETECTFSDDLHLAIEVGEAELESSRAIAISYTWGDFDRSNVDLGHIAHKSHEPVRMELGREWEIPDLITTLVQICIDNGSQHGDEHAAVWIDQLCIPQTSEQIRQALASIPSIYTTLDVVALMPGSRCACLGYGEKDFSRMEVPLCLNAFGLSSYFDRIWTRQELLYSRTIRAVRTSAEELPCMKEYDENPVSPYVRLRLALHKTFAAERSPWDLLLCDQLIFVKNMTSSFQECGLTRDESYGFFAGQRVTKPQRPQDRESRLHNFASNLAYLSYSSRKTTKPRDFVISVWVDCPGYVIPQNFKEMGVPDLMEDALHQLERNHGLTLPTTAVGGLFADCSGGASAVWSPSTYFEGMSLNSTDDIYSVIREGAQLAPVGLNREVPLCIPWSLNMPLSRLAKEYFEVFPWQDATAVAMALEPVFDNIPTNAITNMVGRFAKVALGSMDSGKWIHGTLEIFHFMSYLHFQSAQKRPNLVPPGGAFGQQGQYRPDHRLPSPMVDHYTSVYMLVTLFLGLDFNMCVRHGLKLMVLLDKFPCMGLVRAIPENTQDVVTVCTGLPKNGTSLKAEGDLLYEAVREPGPGYPRYRVFGVWVPFGFNLPYVPGAIIGRCGALS